MSRPSILIIAASARMLAEMATRAGYSVLALDLFGDVDLRRISPGCSLAELGGRGGIATLVAAAERIDSDAVVYGAGLENRPDLVARLAHGRRLLGNDPAVLARVREPAILGAALRSAGAAYPRTLQGPHAPRAAGRSGEWLRKPLCGGGGRGVRRWRGGRLGGEELLQQRIRGRACSAAAVGDGRSTVVLGVSEQLVGDPTFGGRGYAWCGNVVPPRVPAAEHVELCRSAQMICERLVQAFSLRGLFGVDLVWDGRRAWVIEVNPRPPGSLEVIEAVGGAAPFVAHMRAFEGGLAELDPAAVMARPIAAAKAILYARVETVVGDTRDWRDRGVRDIPQPGTRIAAGRPVCTLLATAPAPDVALQALRARAQRLTAELSVTRSSHALC